jgi:hypothetical protein
MQLYGIRRVSAPALSTSLGNLVARISTRRHGGAEALVATSAGGLP